MTKCKPFRESICWLVASMLRKHLRLATCGSSSITISWSGNSEDKQTTTRGQQTNDQTKTYLSQYNILEYISILRVIVEQLSRIAFVNACAQYLSDRIKLIRLLQ